jgi:hypothetical protein
MPTFSSLVLVFFEQLERRLGYEEEEDACDQGGHQGSSNYQMPQVRCAFNF